MSNNQQLVLSQNQKIYGNKYQHNFQNQYYEDDDLKKPSKQVAEAITKFTQNSINSIVGVKTDQTYNTVGMSGFKKQEEAQFIKYTPNQQLTGANSGANQRIIKMHEKQSDPLVPPQFKHRQLPNGPGSPPPTVMHSPPRKLTQEDKQNWKIPPAISNWKNVHGWTIPLEMRVAADGRTLQSHTINEKHAQLSNAFMIAEKQARKEIEERIKLQKQKDYQIYIKQEEEMRIQAQKAREEKNKLLYESNENNSNDLSKRKNPYTTKAEQDQENEQQELERKQRDEIKYIRKREIEREKRLEAAGTKKTKEIRDRERDVSEKIALGQAQPTKTEVLYDQRLYNQSAGLDHGFGDDDEFNAYDKPLFNDRSAASIYKNVKGVVQDDDEDGEGQNEMEKILTKAPARGFEGAEKQKGGRNKPVEFEKHTDEIFGMGSFVDNSTKKVKHN